MFGPFRLTNPLSGGLLWYVIHSALLLNAPWIALWHPLFPPRKSATDNGTLGKSPGASRDTKNTDTEIASGLSIPSSKQSIMRWRDAAKP